MTDLDLLFLDADTYTGFPDDEPKTRPHRKPPNPVRRGSVDQIREWRIQEGECPRGYCGGKLEDNCCTLCGWSLLEQEMRDRLDAREVDWVLMPDGTEMQPGDEVRMVSSYTELPGGGAAVSGDKVLYRRRDRMVSESQLPLDEFAPADLI